MSLLGTRINVAPAVIAENTSLSAAVCIGEHKLLGLMLPATWTAATVTFAVSDAEAGTYLDAFSATAEISLTGAAAGRYLALDPALMPRLPWIKVRSGTTGAAVNQTGARTVSLVLGST